jgi:hypothetical protein
MKLFAAFTLCLPIALSTAISISPAAQYDQEVYQTQISVYIKNLSSFCGRIQPGDLFFIPGEAL